MKNFDEIGESAKLLLDYCKSENWAGYDPYDALNSGLYAITPLAHSRICRIAFTQIMKRLPVDLRWLLLVKKEKNPKGLALFIMAAVKMSKADLLDRVDITSTLVEQLTALRSPNDPYWCWGYCFPWQTRTVLVPRGAPNLVCTTFAANALFDLYEAYGESRYREMAISSAEYLLNELYWEVDGGAVAGFSYPLPTLRSRVHNANFLGSALLLRTFKHTGDRRFFEPALKAAGYSAALQREDGSWDYGEKSTQRWVDNFHTGFNLCALRDISKYAQTSDFDVHISRGFEFYRKHFFRQDGAPKYFHNRTYPIDIHSVAQSIITLLTFKDFNEGNVGLAISVYEWAVHNMRSEKGFFYYQVLPHYTNRISYMRWSQAWMLLALSTIVEDNI